MLGEVTRYDNEPICVITFKSGFDLAADLPRELPEYRAFLECQPEPVVWIADIDTIEFEVGTVIDAANLLALGEEAFYHHPKIRHVIHVTKLPHMQLVTEGMGRDSYGRVKISVAGSLDEAVRMARAIIKSE